MKFQLGTTGHFYPKKERRDELSKLGFEFKPSTYKGYSITGNPSIEIASLAELMALCDEVGDIIIPRDDGNRRIEIYDDYRE